MNPSPEKCFELADIFKKLHHERPEAIVDMKTPYFNGCSTIACHVGWFAVARGLSRKIDYIFSDSADDMARFLGFPSLDHFDQREHVPLQIWAEKNPDIWGNSDGACMFISATAFGKAKGEYLTLLDISNHWRGVGERIAAQKKLETV